jgi:flavin-binding protein dodecin
MPYVLPENYEPIRFLENELRNIAAPERDYLPEHSTNDHTYFALLLLEDTPAAETGMEQFHARLAIEHRVVVRSAYEDVLQIAAPDYIERVRTGSSMASWEDAVVAAVSQIENDVEILEDKVTVVAQEAEMHNGAVGAYRVRVKFATRWQGAG